MARPYSDWWGLRAGVELHRVRNARGLKASQLARLAGHHSVARLLSEAQIAPTSSAQQAASATGGGEAPGGHSRKPGGHAGGGRRAGARSGSRVSRSSRARGRRTARAAQVSQEAIMAAIVQVCSPALKRGLCCREALAMLAGMLRTSKAGRGMGLLSRLVVLCAQRAKLLLSLRAVAVEAEDGVTAPEEAASNEVGPVRDILLEYSATPIFCTQSRAIQSHFESTCLPNRADTLRSTAYCSETRTNAGNSKIYPALGAAGKGGRCCGSGPDRHPAQKGQRAPGVNRRAACSRCWQRRRPAWRSSRRSSSSMNRRQTPPQAARMLLLGTALLSGPARGRSTRRPVRSREGQLRLRRLCRRP